ELFFSSNVKTAISVGQASGVILLAGHQNQLDVYKYTPLQVKKAAVGVGKQVEILAEIDDRIVMAQQKNLLVSAFHPELSNDDRIHRYFLNLVNKRWRQ
ncbi:unnamed protein product, partial [marine sediment metagenome]